MNEEFYNLELIVKEEIQKKGGWVNAHSHLDRAYTLTRDNFELTHAQLQEKWYLNDVLKRQSTPDAIYDRMSRALELQYLQGVRVLATFIDVDALSKDKSIQAAERVKETFGKDMRLYFINQTLQGVLTPEARHWFDIGAEYCDIIGGLPKKDNGREEEHLDILMNTAKTMGKMVHVHVDQLNLEAETETELLARKTIEHGMQGKVVAVHSVSLACQPLEKRRETYALMKMADMGVITCPTAWIDSRRTELRTVTHNSIAPVEELIHEGIKVGIGPDNISDIYKPFCNGDMWTELKFLLESCHFYEISSLVDIATKHGRSLLGIKQ